MAKVSCLVLLLSLRASSGVDDTIAAVQVRASQPEGEVPQALDATRGKEVLHSVVGDFLRMLVSRPGAEDEPAAGTALASLKGPLALQWKTFGVEKDGRFRLAFGPCVVDSASPMGQCQAPGLDSLTVHSQFPHGSFSDAAKVKVGMGLEVFGMKANVTMDCAMCGKPCSAKSPMGPLSFRMPKCPLDGTYDFEVFKGAGGAGAMGMLALNAAITLEIERSGGRKAMQMQMMLKSAA